MYEKQAYLFIKCEWKNLYHESRNYGSNIMRIGTLGVLDRATTTTTTTTKNNSQFSVNILSGMRKRESQLNQHLSPHAEFVPDTWWCFLTC